MLFKTITNESTAAIHKVIKNTENTVSSPQPHHHPATPLHSQKKTKKELRHGFTSPTLAIPSTLSEREQEKTPENTIFQGFLRGSGRKPEM